MSFSNYFQASPSKEIVCEILNEIGESSIKFKDLISEFELAEGKPKQYLSWVMSHAIELHPKLVEEHYDCLIQHMKMEQEHPAIKRNVIRSFQFVEIPEKYQGIIINECLKYIINPKLDIAIRTFSMTVAYNIAKQHPPLLKELATHIEEVMPEGSAAMKSRGRKILHSIHKLEQSVIP